MVMTPQGGPSTGVPPPSIEPNHRPPSRQQRTPQTPLPHGWWSTVAKRGLLLGGLVIVADLAILALQQRTDATADTANAFDTLDLFVNVILFSLAGGLVFRETGLVRLGVWAGTLAGLAAGAVTGAAVALTAQPSTIEPPPTPDQVWFGTLVTNMFLGTLFSALGAWLASRVGRVRGR